MSIIEIFLLIQSYLEKRSSCSTDLKEVFIIKECPAHPESSEELYLSFNCEKNPLEKIFNIIKKHSPINCSFPMSKIYPSDSDLVKKNSHYFEKLFSFKEDLSLSYSCLVFETWKAVINDLIAKIDYNNSKLNPLLFKFKAAVSNKEISEEFSFLEKYFNYSCSSLFMNISP